MTPEIYKPFKGETETQKRRMKEKARKLRKKRRELNEERAKAGFRFFLKILPMIRLLIFRNFSLVATLMTTIMTTKESLRLREMQRS